MAREMLGAGRAMNHGTGAARSRTLRCWAAAMEADDRRSAARGTKQVAVLAAAPRAALTAAQSNRETGVVH